MFFSKFLSNISEHLNFIERMPRSFNVILPKEYFSFDISKEYSEPSRKSKVDPLAKIVNSWKPLTIFAKFFNLDVRLGSECGSVFLYSIKKKFTTDHSHKKWKDSLQVSLLRVLFTAELEFPKMLVPGLLQNTSNANK